MKLTVNLGKSSYPIYIENQILSNASTYIKEVFHGRKIMIVSDDNVYPLYGDLLVNAFGNDFEIFHLVLPHGEATKSFNSLPLIYNALLEAQFSRSDCVIALGGGVIGDLAGFAAASFLRGIKLIQIPTSLLAQVDSSVGGKVAVDLPQGKNLVGAFYQPSLVLIDPEVLKTLPEHFVHDGMGEVIKYGCIMDPKLFSLLRSHTSFEDLGEDLNTIIYRCIDCKRTVVEEDQFDTGNRMLLNFGHTLAHAIEQHYHYEKISHGEAVAIGMYQLTKLAEEKGLTKKGCANDILKLLHIYALPSSSNVPLGTLLKAIKLDKKNLNAHLNLILLHEIGDSYIYKTDIHFFNEESRTI